MTNKERFLHVLRSTADKEELLDIKFFKGQDRAVSSDVIYGMLADSLTKENLGLLKRISLEEREKHLKDLTVDDLDRI